MKLTLFRHKNTFDLVKYCKTKEPSTRIFFYILWKTSVNNFISKLIFAGMHHIPRLSDAVYVGMCRYVGSPTEERIRREMTDTVGMVCRPVGIVRGLDMTGSGSRREGFRLPTSNVDWMLWPPDHKVICDLCQISLYRIPQKSDSHGL